jgi:hypothetical protein
MITLKTKARGVPFSYEKTVHGDVHIEFGRGRKVMVAAADWRRLIQQFRGRQVQLGTSRDRPPPGSVGEWLQQNVTPVAIASYVGPILVHEACATWVDRSTLQFVE